MKKNLIRAIAIAGVATLGFVGTAFAGPNGVWKSNTGRDIEVFNCGGGLGMKIVKSSNSAHIGKVIMCGAKANGANKWKGSVLNVDDGKTYSGFASLQGNNALKVEGCADSLGILCQGHVWSRIR